MTMELIRLSARSVRDLLKERQVSPLELLDALEHRISEVDSAVNAVPTLCFERARQRARERDLSDLPLAGIPVAIKDLLPVSGVRTHSVPWHTAITSPRFLISLSSASRQPVALSMPNPIPRIWRGS